MFGRAKDPVCGAKVKKTTLYQSTWNGRRFYFDCAACRATFEGDPYRFAGNRETKGFFERLSETSDGRPKSCHDVNRLQHSLQLACVRGNIWCA